MKSKLFYILLILLPVSVFGQEYVQVNTEYNPTDKWNEIIIEIVNKSDGEMFISNVSLNRMMSFFEIYFLDQNGKRIEMSILQFPFMNAAEIPKKHLKIKSNSSITFNYSYDNFILYCKYPDKIKELKIKYHIEYAIVKDKEVITDGICTYEQFSKTICQKQ